MHGTTRAFSPRFAPVTVRNGSSRGSTRSPPWWVRLTMNCSGESITYRLVPAATRRSVLSASGFLRSKMLGHGTDQSMHSAAVLHGFKWLVNKSVPIFFGLVLVGSGQTIGNPSHRATRNNRLRIVGVS